jgi:hypothetical protein
VRHVRILGLALVTALVVSMAVAGNALAIKNPDFNSTIFRHCPTFAEVEGHRTTFCFVAATEESGPSSGEYKVGNFTVPLAKQIVLQFGSVLNEETGAETFVPASGAPTLIPTAEKVPGFPIAAISPKEREELGWPKELSEKYEHAKVEHEVTKVFETIELAGEPAISRSNLIVAEGTAVEVPVKVKASNRWLTTLGDECYIGSNEDPITQHLTSGKSVSPLTGQELVGEVGELDFRHEFQEVIITHSDLVDNTYAVPTASCTGPFSEQIAATINKVFGLPAPAGASFTRLKGTLYNATAEWVNTQIP